MDSGGTAVPADVQVVGAAALDDNFTGGADRLTYHVPVKNAAWPITLHAQLLFQPVTPGFVQDLNLDGGPYVGQFLGYHQAADPAPDLVSELNQVIAKPLLGD